MDDTADNSKQDEHGITFQELEPGVYLAEFIRYSTDKEVNAQQAEHYLKLLQQAAKKHTKINVINDTTEVGGLVKGLSPAAREAYREAYDLPQINRVAMVGFSSWLKNFIVVLARVANRTAQTSFFETKEEALKWIREE